MKNTINTLTRNINGNTRVSVSMATKKNLSQYTPKGCPFNNYTLLDLLRDLIQMYSWKITRGTATSIKTFIKQLQREGYDKAMAYGDDIINLIED